MLHSERTYAGSSYNLNYELNINKSRLSGAASAIHYDVDEIQVLKNTGPDTVSRTWRAGLENQYIVSTAQADYATPFANGTLEPGGKIAVLKTTNDTRYENYESHSWEPDSTRTNRFLYDERIFATYINYSRQYIKFTYNASLRLENTRSLAISPQQVLVNGQNYYKWLPAFSLNYTINEKESFSLEASRKLRRPNFDELDPYRIYSAMDSVSIIPLPFPGTGICSIAWLVM